MSLAIAVTEKNQLYWDAVFSLFSIERCANFYEDMALPEAVIQNPQDLIEHARKYLQEQAVSTPSDHNILSRRKRQVENTFQRIGERYDQETATLIHTWCFRYIVDRENVNQFFAWHELFFDICDSEFNTELMDTETVNRICRVINLDQYQNQIASLNRRLDIVGALEFTEWEKWLDERDRYSAGEAYAIHPVEAALNRVALVAAQHYEDQILLKL